MCCMSVKCAERTMSVGRTWRIRRLASFIYIVRVVDARRRLGGSVGMRLFKYTLWLHGLLLSNMNQVGLRGGRIVRARVTSIGER